MASVHYHSQSPRLFCHSFFEFITASSNMEHSTTLAVIFLMAMVQLAAMGTPAMACIYCPKTKPPPIKPPPALQPPPLKPPPIKPPPTLQPPPLKPPPTAPPAETCPLNALKLGACVDALGGLVHVGIGDPVENVCCPVLAGVLSLEAALCLCETIQAKVLTLNIFLPLALELLVICGKIPPPGFTCPSS